MGEAPAEKSTSVINGLNCESENNVICVAFRVAYVYRKQTTGVEPAFSAWEADVLPIYDVCMTLL